MEYLAGHDYQTKGILVHPSLTPNPHKSGHKEVNSIYNLSQSRVCTKELIFQLNHCYMQAINW